MIGFLILLFAIAVALFIILPETGALDQDTALMIWGDILNLIIWIVVVAVCLVIGCIGIFYVLVMRD